MWLLTHRAPATEPAAETPGRVHFRFLGTAGFTIVASGRTLVLDPFLSRPGVWRTLFGRLVPDEAIGERWVPRADEVLCGHAHHDHVLDAPAVCRRTGARLLGSSAVGYVAAAAGLDASKFVRALPLEPVACGPASATALPSRHGRAFFGCVPLLGDIAAPPPWPPRLYDLRHGDVLHWLIEVDGFRILHVDSADFIDEHVPRCDVLLLCAIGRQYRQDYTRRICELARPSVVVPCHWDDFTLPLDVPPRQLPGVDVEGFVGEIRSAGARPVVLSPGQDWALR